MENSVYSLSGLIKEFKDNKDSKSRAVAHLLEELQSRRELMRECYELVEKHVFLHNQMLLDRADHGEDIDYDKFI